MSLKGKITEDIKLAMKAGAKNRLKALRLIMAEVKQVEVDQREELDGPAILGILNKMVKQRQDSIKLYRAGEREDLAQIEAAEIAVIETYLPEQLSNHEIEKLIDEAVTVTKAEHIRDMGKVMGMVKSKAQGRADMAIVSGKVKARLGT
ncbi:uncharacterized protein METZ01_LOCUS306954 [marine metagenome]|uniref:GatB/YqeY domain-containing protein n=1 Tax=marine metagenome TaxID=408172 RepID=A0A382N003_9ZZZZ